jgi:hypothetical protein
VITASCESRYRQRQQEQRQTSERHKDEFFDSQAAAISPQRVQQELHRRPLTNTKPPAIQQVDYDRDRNRPKPNPKYHR